MLKDKTNKMQNPLVRPGMEETSCCKVRLHLVIFIRMIERSDRRQKQFLNGMLLLGTSFLQWND